MSSFGGYADAVIGERMWRQRLYFTLADEDDSDIDPTSTVGLYVIEHFRPELRCSADWLRYDDIGEIRKWIEQQYEGGGPDDGS
jgi:hypothetical protein